MMILALDVGENRTGWLCGPAGRVAPPRLWLRRAGEDQESAIGRFGQFVRDQCESGKPDLICIEHYMHLTSATASGSIAREGQLQLHGAVLGIAACYGIRVVRPMPSSVRVCFCGRASAAPRSKRGERRPPNRIAADRAATKAMVIARARQLGYLSPACIDDNLADAAALHAFASHEYACCSVDDLLLV